MEGGSSPVGLSSSSSSSSFEQSWSEGDSGDNVLKANEETDSDYSSSSSCVDDDNFTSLSWPPNGDHYADRAFSLTECFEEDRSKHSSTTQGNDHSSSEKVLSAKLSEFLKDTGKFLEGSYQVVGGGDDFKQFLIASEENFNKKRRDSFINMQAIFLCAQLLSIAFLHLYYLRTDCGEIATTTNQRLHHFPLNGGEIKTLTAAIFCSEDTTPALIALSAMSWASTVTTSDYRFVKCLHRYSPLLALFAYELYSHRTTHTLTASSFPHTIHAFIFKYATPATLIYTSIEPDYLAIVLATLLSLNVAASLEEPNSSSSSTTLILTGISAIAFNFTLFAFRASSRKEDFIREYNTAVKRRQTELALISSYAQLHHTPLNFLQRIASTTRQMIDCQHTGC